MLWWGGGPFGSTNDSFFGFIDDPAFDFDGVLAIRPLMQVQGDQQGRRSLLIEAVAARAPWALDFVAPAPSGAIVAASFEPSAAFQVGFGTYHGYDYVSSGGNVSDDPTRGRPIREPCADPCPLLDAAARGHPERLRQVLQLPRFRGVWWRGDAWCCRYPGTLT